MTDQIDLSKTAAEFPDYPAAALPALPAGFVDVSWRNDQCPNFHHTAKGLSLYVDYPAPGDREFPESPRFTLHRLINWAGADGWQHDDDTQLVGAQDEWPVILAMITAEPERRPVAFTFEDGPTFHGFADGTTWNGWPNVRVTPAERERIAAHIEATEGDEASEEVAQLRALEPGADCLVSLANGWTPTLVEEA